LARCRQLNDVVEWFENPERGPEHLDVSFIDRTLEEEGATVVSTVKRLYRRRPARSRT
jgi:hypothetical protein